MAEAAQSKVQVDGQNAQSPEQKPTTLDDQRDSTESTAPEPASIAPVSEQRVKASSGPKRASVASRLAQQQGAFIGGAVAASLVGLVWTMIRRRKKQRQQSAQNQAQAQANLGSALAASAQQVCHSSTHTHRGFELQPFGSPVDPGTPIMKKMLAKEASSEKDSARKADQLNKSKAVSPAKPAVSHETAPADSSVSMQDVAVALKMLREMQEENAKLRAFMHEHAATSKKVELLEQENQTLKEAKGKIEGQLDDLKAKSSNAFAFINGEELQRFKLALRMPSQARSVCSDVDGFGKDTASVDGSASVAGTDVNLGRKKAATLSTFFKYMTGAVASSDSRAASVAPSQPATPKGRTVEVSMNDVVHMLDAWGGARH